MIAGRRTGCLSINVTNLTLNISANITDIALHFLGFIDNNITF